MISRFIKRTAFRLCIGAATLSLGAMTQASVVDAEKLADQLMEYRLPDGGVLVSKASQPTGRLVPYFANLAALGWTETARVTTNTQKRAAYLQATRSWLDWYASHQNANGTIYDFEGPTSKLEPTGSYDSTDSYASTYAVLMLRYYEVSQDKDYLHKKLSSLNGAYDAILLTMDKYGLTYAHPHYAYRFLMDNCEVAAGFTAFQEIYTILGVTDKAVRAQKHLDNIKEQFSKFYLPAQGAFAYAIDPFGTRVGDFTRGYPDAMANLFAITYLAPPGTESSELLNKIKKKFAAKPDSQNFPQWWVWPAMICGDADLQNTALGKLRTQAEEETAHSYLVGMAAATFATGVNSIRFPEVVSTWPQLTDIAEQRPAAPATDNLVVPGTSVIITGNKASGTLASGKWHDSSTAMPVAVDYKITTSSGYLQVNFVWPQPLTLKEYSGFTLEYNGLDVQKGTQLQVTVIEDDGDWWNAPMPPSGNGINRVQLDFDNFTANPWGKGGDQKRDFSGCNGIRFQVVNKTNGPISGAVEFTAIRLYKKISN